MMEQLEKYDGKQEHFDIFPYIKRCALDIICETAMGTTVSAQTGKTTKLKRKNNIISSLQ